MPKFASCRGNVITPEENDARAVFPPRYRFRSEVRSRVNMLSPHLPLFGAERRSPALLMRMASRREPSSNMWVRHLCKIALADGFAQPSLTD